MHHQLRVEWDSPTSALVVRDEFRRSFLSDFLIQFVVDFLDEEASGWRITVEDTLVEGKDYLSKVAT